MFFPWTFHPHSKHYYNRILYSCCWGKSFHYIFFLEVFSVKPHVEPTSVKNLSKRKGRQRVNSKRQPRLRTQHCFPRTLQDTHEHAFTPRLCTLGHGLRLFHNNYTFHAVCFVMWTDYLDHMINLLCRLCKTVYPTRIYAVFCWLSGFRNPHKSWAHQV